MARSDPSASRLGQAPIALLPKPFDNRLRILGTSERTACNAHGRGFHTLLRIFRRRECKRPSGRAASRCLGQSASPSNVKSHRKYRRSRSRYGYTGAYPLVPRCRHRRTMCTSMNNTWRDAPPLRAARSDRCQHRGATKSSFRSTSHSFRRLMKRCTPSNVPGGRGRGLWIGVQCGTPSDLPNALINGAVRPTANI